MHRLPYDLGHLTAKLFTIFNAAMNIEWMMSPYFWAVGQIGHNSMSRPYSRDARCPIREVSQPRLGRSKDRFLPSNSGPQMCSSQRLAIFGHRGL